MVTEQELAAVVEDYYLGQDNVKKFDYDQFYQDTGLARTTFKPYGGLKRFCYEHTRFIPLRNERALQLIARQMEKIVETYGYASMNLYIQIHDRGHLHHGTLVRWFGSLIRVRELLDMQITDKCFSWCFDHTKEEYVAYLSGIQDMCGYVSENLVKTTKGITMKAIRNYFYSLENACTQLGFVYRPDPTKKSKLQQKAEAIFHSFTGLPFVVEKTWKWLVYKKKMRVDLYCPSMNLAVEVDGAQHYKRCDYFHKTSERFLESVRRDTTKDFLLKIHRIRLLRLTEKDLEVFPMLLMAILFTFNAVYDLCAF